MTLRRAILAASATLAEAGVDSARTDAELLAAHIAGVDRGLLAFAEDPGEDFYPRYAAAVRERSARVPLQHIIGTAPFGPLTVQVGPGVFIPRPETEAMLEWAAAQPLADGALIVDVCTGSGALAAGLSHYHPGSRVIAVDDDPVALSYARRNTAHAAVDVVEGDATDPGLLADLDGTVDLVVSNPPYIPAGTALDPEVAEHDPDHALFGGPDGLAVIRPLVSLAGRWLRDGGLFAVEHDDTTSDSTIETIRAAGGFADIEAHTDLAGRPRFVTAVRRRRQERGNPL